MEVHNVKYDEVNKLLNDLYSKYININNSADIRTPFIRETLTKISEGDINEVDFGKKIDTDGTTVLKNYNIDKSSFTDLIREAIYCKLGNIVADEVSAIDNTKNSKGYLKFVKSGTLVAGKVRIEKNIDIRNNIICSINLINVFIDILEAYKNFMDDQRNLAHLKKQVNNIIIVNKNARKYDDYSSTAPSNLGYWVDGDSGSGSNKLATSTLFLSIDSYQVTGSNYDNTNKLLHDFIVKYDIINNIINDNDSSYATSEITSAHSSTNGLINSSGEVVGASNSAVDYITGIVLTKTDEGTPIVKRAKNSDDLTKDFNLNDIDNTKIEASADDSDIYEVLLKRDKELLKDFLNMIVNLDLVNRRTQIKGMLTYFKIIKEYLYIAITTGNLLFNSYYNTINISTQDDPQYPTDFTNTSSPTSGYAIKYLTESDILSESNSIYTNNQTSSSDNVESIEPADSTNPADIPLRLKKSIFGLAKEENDKDGGYIQKIIENIQDLQNIGAEETGMSMSSTFDFSDSGFIALIENDSTIRIKSRADFLINQRPVSNSNSLSSIIYASSPDGEKTGNTNFTDDTTFDVSLVNTAVSDGNMSNRIKNYLIDKNVNKLSKEYIIKINNISYELEKIDISADDKFELVIKARLRYPTQSSSPHLNSIPILQLPYNKVTLFDSDDNYLGSGVNNPDRYYRSLESARGCKIYFHNMASASGEVDNKVKLNIKSSLDYKTGYIGNIESIKSINYSINANESRIKNAKTLYDLNKSKYNVIYYQLISYIVILAGIIVALILTNTMNMSKPITKLIASVCFGIVVLQFVTYYILSVLYIEAFTTSDVVEKFSQYYEPPNIVGSSIMEFTSNSEGNYPEQKVKFVQNQLILLNNNIIHALELSNVAVGQASSNEAYTKLLNITEFERVSRGNTNSILAIQSDGSKMHIDLLKYSTAVHTINIKTVLMLSLAIVGLFTINVYTDSKYMENLAFVGGFILIIILAYYLIYSNSVVRTRSNNVYWGKEHKTNYSDF
jgi:hypothetical protein